MTIPTPLDVVLVHGAWHGPSCWDRVSAELARRGITTHTPALPSTGPDPGSLGGFDDDVASVRQALDRSGPAVVCAHSYAGLVVGAVQHPASRHLVFLSAFMADEGEDWAAVASDDTPTLLADGLRADEHGNLIVDPDCAADCFYADCEPDDIATAIHRLQPQAAEPFTRTMPSPAWQSIPSMFVICEEDSAISPERQRAMAKRADSTRSLPTSHSPMLSRPDLVVDILEELARDGLDRHG
jgi:pimeloyl-ACP methyl ester carboxylesterase